jgi:hypothetical protein
MKFTHKLPRIRQFHLSERSIDRYLFRYKHFHLNCFQLFRKNFYYLLIYFVNKKILNIYKQELLSNNLDRFHN